MALRRYVLFRHAETDANIENRFVSGSDFALNDYGRRQLQVLRADFSGRSFDAVFSSPARRCIETAEALVAGSSCSAMRVVEDRRLREVDAGVLEGLRRDEAELSDVRDLLLAWESEQTDWITANAGLWGGPGAVPEPLALAAERIASLWRQVLHQKNVRSALIVSHGTILRLLVCNIVGIPFSRYRAFRIETAGYFEVAVDDSSHETRLVALAPGPSRRSFSEASARIC